MIQTTSERLHPTAPGRAKNFGRLLQHALGRLLILPDHAVFNQEGSGHRRAFFSMREHHAMTHVWNFVQTGIRQPSLEPSTPSGLTLKTDEPDPPLNHRLKGPKCFDDGQNEKIRAWYPMYDFQLVSIRFQNVRGFY
tara:strand:- start:627 stop:1037 length:411 start_codon:yes stop_codon:yes gene_type:complete